MGPFVMSELAEVMEAAKLQGEASIAKNVMPDYCDGVLKFKALAWTYRDQILAALRPPEGDVVEAVARAMFAADENRAGAWEARSSFVQDNYLAMAQAALATLNLPARLQAAREEGAKAERERCAKVAEHRHELWKMPHRDDAEPGEVCDDITACADIAQAIRSAP